MKVYQLQPDEVIRFQAPVFQIKEEDNIPTELTLTNLNFIFVTERKKFLWFKRKNRTVVIPKEQVKKYRELPEIKQTDTSVKICFAKEDYVIVFDTKKDARNFVINAWEIVTGKTVFERNLDKLKDALDLVDEKLHINIADIVKAGLTQGMSGFICQTAKNLFSFKKS